MIKSLLQKLIIQFLLFKSLIKKRILSKNYVFSDVKKRAKALGKKAFA
jgi:hypothetical protein